MISDLCASSGGDSKFGMPEPSMAAHQISSPVRCRVTNQRAAFPRVPYRLVTTSRAPSPAICATTAVHHESYTCTKEGGNGMLPYKGHMCRTPGNRPLPGSGSTNACLSRRRHRLVTQKHE